MNIQAKIDAVLKQVCPDEYIIAGEESVQRIVKSGLQDDAFYKAKGGSNFDVTGVLTILSTVTVIIKNVFDIYQKIKPENGAVEKKDVIEKTKTELSAKNIKYNDDTLNKVVESVLSASM